VCFNDSCTNVSVELIQPRAAVEPTRETPPLCPDCGKPMNLARPDGLYLCANMDCIPKDFYKGEFACLTGDCPHETQAECDAWIRNELLEQAKELGALRAQLAEASRDSEPLTEEERAVLLDALDKARCDLRNERERSSLWQKRNAIDAHIERLHKLSAKFSALSPGDAQ